MIPLALGLIGKVAAAAVLPRVVKAVCDLVRGADNHRDSAGERCTGEPSIRNNPVNLVDPSGLDAWLDIVSVTGGTYNPLGHAFLEVTPIGGTDSLWQARESYASYPKGIVSHEDLNFGYGPGTTRDRLRIRLNNKQERDFLKFKERAKKRKWSPQENCGFFAIEGWNAVAPVGSKLDPKRAREDIKPSMVSDPRVKRAIQAHRLLTGGYPSEITPRRLGDYIEQLPGAQEEVTPR